MSTPPPLKRHRTLAPLSREHMSGLVQARNLRRGANENAHTRRATVAAFVEAWKSEIRDHFDDEERLLLPLTRDQALRDRLRQDHSVLRELAQRCIDSPDMVASDPALMQRIGSLLHDHIRWEEREYFETIQCDHSEALESMLHEADRIEKQRPGSRPRRSINP